MLGRREHSARELARKLAGQGLAEGEASRLVEELRHEGWQSDARYAELLVRSRVSQGYGPRRIGAELTAHGVDAALVREALAAADCDWTALAAQVHDKHFPQAARGAAERLKRYRYLAGRGFEAGHIRAAMQGAAPDAFDE